MSTSAVVSGKARKGSEITVEALIREGVNVIFGYPGGASMEIHQALTRVGSDQDLRVILPRHEQGAIFAAEGYAKATGRVGVALATSGPGATNLITGIADAKMDSVPIVAITGQVPEAMIGKDAFQETDVVGISRPITKHNYLVQRVEDLPRIVKEAFYIASTGRPGPVVIDIPKNVQQSECIPEWSTEMDLSSYRPYIEAGKRELEQVVRAIRSAKKPIIYAGNGTICANASEELREFVEKTGIPIVMTVLGLGVFPSNHPLCFDMLGMHGAFYANYAVNHADLLLAFGVRFDDRVTGKVEEFAKHGTIVHVDIDASEINKIKEANIPVTSDIRYVLQQLNKMDLGQNDHTQWVQELEKVKKQKPFRYQDDGKQIMPQYVLQLLSEKTKGKVIITTGVGQHQMWAAQYFKFLYPRTMLTSAGLGAMGFGFPAALGAKLGCPQWEVIDIDGDGSFLMNIQELATACVEEIAVKALIINNQHLGMVVQWEDRFYSSNRAHTYIGNPRDRERIYPDFVSIAKGFDIPARRITTKDEVSEALDEMLASDKPYVLDVVVPYTEHVLPMIPTGRTFADIIYEE
ncbi:biosynthetic-type acetolactate synthase large subunit [Acidobacteria bacterium AH-259-D05]|nr:biosynthetic-type acetolactate synthase large subunit [Acidobacteria bacterium AH-259-D05]